MIVGFNHNILHRGAGFHVQTEDGGLKSPNLVTLLYHGGIIITSQKTSYADILSVDNLNHVIEELAKEQHKAMLRRLTRGEFDARICEFGIAIEGFEKPPKNKPLVEEITPLQELSSSLLTAPHAEVVAEVESIAPVATVEALEPAVVEPVKAVKAQEPLAVEPVKVSETEPLAIEPAFEPMSAEDRNQRPNLSEALDDLIFSYLTGGDEAN